MNELVIVDLNFHVICHNDKKKTYIHGGVTIQECR